MIALIRVTQKKTGFEKV